MGIKATSGNTLGLASFRATYPTPSLSLSLSLSLTHTHHLTVLVTGGRRGNIKQISCYLHQPESETVSQVCVPSYSAGYPLGTWNTIKKEGRQKHPSSVTAVFQNNRQEEGEISLILMKRMNSEIF